MGSIVTNLLAIARNAKNDLTRQSLLLQAVSLALLIFSGASGLCAEATGQVLWTIGKVDNSTLEFNNKWDFTAGGNPEFVAGKSDPRKRLEWVSSRLP